MLTIAIVTSTALVCIAVLIATYAESLRRWASRGLVPLRAARAVEPLVFTPPADIPSCAYCAGYHTFACPYIESIEYDGPIITKIVFRREHFKHFAKQIAWIGDTVAS